MAFIITIAGAVLAIYGIRTCAGPGAAGRNHLGTGNVIGPADRHNLCRTALEKTEARISDANRRLRTHVDRLWSANESMNSAAARK
jgi:hypothetical protein